MAMSIPSPTCYDRIQRKLTAPETVGEGEAGEEEVGAKSEALQGTPALVKRKSIP